MLQSLSNIELYYAAEESFGGNLITIAGEEFNHLIKVMRHREEDEIFVTDGNGKIYSARITKIRKDNLIAELGSSKSYENIFSNVTFCLPKLKNLDRFEFALEKCVELGITNFIIYDAVRGTQKSNKVERWEKICTSAMKQSLRSHLPVLVYIKRLSTLLEFEGKKILIDQSGGNSLWKVELKQNENYFFIFGPEGGFDEQEFSLFNSDEIYFLSQNRLRSETALVSAAVVISYLKE